MINLNPSTNFANIKLMKKHLSLTCFTTRCTFIYSVNKDINHKFFVVFLFRLFQNYMRISFVFCKFGNELLDPSSDLKTHPSMSVHQTCA